MLGGLAIDSSNNVYVAGYTDGQDWPTTPGAYQSASPGGICDIPAQQPCWNGFLTKLNATASALVFSTYLGESDASTFVNSVAVDASHNAFVVGNTGSTKFPITSDAFQKACVGGTGTCFDAILTRFNKAGSGLLYSTFLGGSGGDAATGIALTSTPSAVVVGETNLPPVALCRNVIVSAGMDCMAMASINNGSFDPEQKRHEEERRDVEHVPLLDSVDGRQRRERRHL